MAPKPYTCYRNHIEACIQHDPRRTEGNWYAQLDIIKDTYLNPDTGGQSEFISRSQRSIQVTLPGPGRAKAIRKIRSHLDDLGLKLGFKLMPSD